MPRAVTWSLLLGLLSYIWARDFTVTEVQRPQANKRLSGEDFFYPKGIINEYKKLGRKTDHLLSIDQFSPRAFAKSAIDWPQQDEDGNFVIAYGFGPGTEDWYADVDKAMSLIESDIGCFKTVRVDDMSDTEWKYGMVIANSNQYGSKGCWSSLGLAPGFYGHLSKTVPQMGGPADWQAIAFGDGCGGPLVGNVHHEVGHMLGRIHVFLEPDRDQYMDMSANAEEQSPMYIENHIQSSRYPLEIGSTMNYCSGCITLSGTDDITSKSGETWSSGGGHTTLDILKIEEHYCKDQPAEGYKNIVQCPDPDLGGIYLPVFADRLCDNVPDCPGGTDEDGSMFECKLGESTTNGCCSTIVVRVDLNGGLFECNFERSQAGVSNSDFEGWTCQDDNWNSGNQMYLKYVTWLDSWLLETVHDLDSNSAANFYTISASNSTCPPTTGWDNDFSIECKKYGTVVPMESIQTTYTKPPIPIDLVDTTGCCSDFTIRYGNQESSCYFSKFFPETLRGNNLFFYSIAYDCVSRSSSASSSIGFAGGVWWYLKGSISDNEHLFEDVDDEKWNELNRLQTHGHYDKNYHTCPDLNPQDWTPAMTLITCTSYYTTPTTSPPTTKTPSWESGNNSPGSSAIALQLFCTMFFILLCI